MTTLHLMTAPLRCPVLGWRGAFVFVAAGEGGEVYRSTGSSDPLLSYQKQYQQPPVLLSGSSPSRKVSSLEAPGRESR
jgi:hypothetical protein